MYRKSNPIATAPFCSQDQKQHVFSDEWQTLKTFSKQLAILYRRNSNEYAIRYVHTFMLHLPSRISEADSFMLLYHSPDELSTTAEKLKYFRLKNHLYQDTIAKFLQIKRGTYANYEDPLRDYSPIEHLQKLADFYHVPIDTLLDDYNRFLYNGQGSAIRSLRKSKNLTQRAFAQQMNLSVVTIQQWEWETCKISKNTYLKLFG